MEVNAVVAALGHVSKGNVFAYLRDEVPEESILGAIQEIKRSGLPSLRAKVAAEFIVPSTIKSGRAYQHKHGLSHGFDGCIWKMLKVSASLIRGAKESSGRVVANKTYARWGVEVFDMLPEVKDKGLPCSMLRSCGESLSMAELRSTLDKMHKWMTCRDYRKRKLARNLLCAGYIECNGAEGAFVALENDPILSKVTIRTPWHEMVETFKRALRGLKLRDKFSVRRVQAIYYSVSIDPGIGEELTKKTIEADRPDLKDAKLFVL